jgi:hypothetical protein
VRYFHVAVGVRRESKPSLPTTAPALNVQRWPATTPRQSVTAAWRRAVVAKPHAVLDDAVRSDRAALANHRGGHPITALGPDPGRRGNLADGSTHVRGCAARLPRVGRMQRLCDPRRTQHMDAG